MTAKEVQDEVIKLNPSYNANSVYNIGPRLDGHLIDRTGGNWRLIDENKAPILHEGYCWGPIEIFQKPEMAAHRRGLVLHVLRASTDGLMQMQIFRQLQASRLCKAPLAKDLVKMDIQQLSESGKIKRIGRTKKWTGVDKKPSDPKGAGHWALWSTPRTGFLLNTSWRTPQQAARNKEERPMKGVIPWF